MTQRLIGDEVLPPMAGEQPRSNHANSSQPRNQTSVASRNRWSELNEFIDFAIQKLSRTDALIWLVLFRDARNGIAKSSQTSIATRTGVSRRTVVRAIKRLQGMGLLEIAKQGGLNRGTNHYRLSAKSKLAAGDS
jgi:DNA-binding transcriptional ArsR family regulator